MFWYLTAKYTYTYLAVIYMFFKINKQLKEWLQINIEMISWRLLLSNIQYSKLRKGYLNSYTWKDFLFSMQVAHDASYFFMINSTSGFLYQSKIFDNEDITFIQCDQWKEGGFLNITATVNWIYLPYKMYRSFQTIILLAFF